VTAALADPAVQVGLDKIGFLGAGNSPRAFLEGAQVEAKNLVENHQPRSSCDRVTVTKYQ
jgi:hypothetical protein